VVLDLSFSGSGPDHAPAPSEPERARNEPLCSAKFATTTDNARIDKSADLDATGLLPLSNLPARL
jgi:hypothetical protein